MDLWDRVKDALGVNRTAIHAALDGGTGVRFAVDATAVPAALFGLTTYEDAITPAPRVTRAEAIQCAAVKRARDVIAGTLGSLPLDYLDTDYRRSRSALLEQPERDVPRSVTMVQTFEDLLFEGRAFWRVVERDWRGYPKKVKRLDPRSVDIRDEQKTYVRRDGSTQGQAWDYVPDSDIIRFWSPNDALLVAAARSIRQALELDAAAARYANEPMPMGYFSPREGADPADDADIVEILDGWNADRQQRATGYVPEALTYNPVQFSPEQIQLAGARQHAVLDIARHAGLDPEDLGVSTTSRTYQNGDSRQRALIDNTLSPYMVAVQDRLSMGDVTPGGYRAAFDLNGFLRSNEDQRIQTYAKALEAGLYDRELIRQREQLPPIDAPAAAQVTALRVVPTTREVSVAATAAGGATFEDNQLHLGFEVDEPSTNFEVNREQRTIYGLAVPYGVAARSNGRRFVFSKGSIRLPKDVGRVKLLVSHDRSQAVGKAIELEDTESGLWARFKVARGPAGDHALSMAEDGVWDGLSIGTTDDAHFEERGGLWHAVDVPIWETSLTPHPAFSDARVSAVAAEADTKGTTMPETGTETAAPAAVTFDQNALAAAMAQALRDNSGPIPVSVAGGHVESVKEALPYRFDGTRGEHDFSTDLFSMGQGDWEAKQRVERFMAEAFDVDTADAGTALNPSPTRPDLYVDQREFRYPLWEAVRSGTLSDNTPFIVPKFNTSSGLVANHTEGVEPTPGAFTATSQTITPQAVSGKVEITREVWDRGGNPQLSGLIWRQMVRAYYEALEQYVVTVLDAASPTGITVTTAAADKALAKEVAQKLAALQFVRGGFRFDTLALQVDLYQALVAAVDDSGRPLFPLLGPANANGQFAPLWGSVNVGGLQGIPTWALAQTGTAAASSYLFDREAVHGWATAPQRLTFEYRVAYIDVAIWGYKAAAITDLAGVREVIYDPAA